MSFVSGGDVDEALAGWLARRAVLLLGKVSGAGASRGFGS